MGRIIVKNMTEFTADALAAAVEVELDATLAVHEVAKVVAAETKRRMEMQFVDSNRTGALRRSVRVTRNKLQALISVGGPKIPYAGWWEFGGSSKSPIWGKGERAYKKAGRSLFPAMKSLQPHIDRVAEAAGMRMAGRIR